MSDPLFSEFPGLAVAGYHITSPADGNYNCIAWAASRKDRWWWPDPDGYWPLGAPMVPTVAAFGVAYGTLGYTPCPVADFEIQYEKVCVFAHPTGQPTHAARQLENGRWTSKLGNHVDIEHATPEALNGALYGSPVLYMRRSRPIWRQVVIRFKRLIARWPLRRLQVNHRSARHSVRAFIRSLAV